MPNEARREKRLPVALKLRITLPLGELELFTKDVSLSGFSARLDEPPPMGEELDCTIFLPDGGPVSGTCSCRHRREGGLVGFSFAPGKDDAVFWEIFVEQEESTGSLWRMLARYAATSDDAPVNLHTVFARGSIGALKRPISSGPAGTGDEAAGRPAAAMRLHTVGETGEAYRIMFARHPSDLAEESDLCRSLPGFADLASGALVRVLRERVLIRLNDVSPITPVRPLLTLRGDYTFIERDGDSWGLVSLAVGEMMLIEVDGQSVFPHFTPGELERIARDSGEWEVAPTDPGEWEPPKTDPGIPTEMPPPEAGDSPAERLVRAAQDASDQFQERKYGERMIRLFPRVWAFVVDADGSDLMGPTLQDGERTCLLALKGKDAPRVAKLSDAQSVALMDPPGSSDA